MNKLGQIIVLFIAFSIVMLLSLIVVPDILVPMANTANTTIAATSNMTNYPGTSEALVATPWVVFLSIPVIIIVTVIFILRPQVVDDVRRRLGL